MNKVFLSGNLTRDPEIRYTPNGRAMTRMGIAVNRRFAKTADNNQPTVDFFNLVAWEKTAEFCGKYLAKGSHVVVEGRMQTYSYEGKDGTQKSGIDIIVENIEFGTNKRDNVSGGRQDYGNNGSRNEFRKNTEERFSGEEISDDDVPF